MKLKKMVAVALTMSMAAAMMPATAMAEEVTDVTEEAVVEVAEEAAEEAAEAVAQVDDETYATLAEAVAAAGDRAEVTLLKSTEGAGIVIDKDITIDFGGKTYALTEPVGSTGTESNGFQILKDNDVTLKNGTLEVAKDAANAFYILVQNYADLKVEKMKLDGTYLDKYSKSTDPADGDSYVLSNNHGTVSITGTTIKANNDGDKAFAFDVCKFASYDAPTVTVDKECEVYGNIEVSPEATLVIEGGSFTDLANAVKYAKGGATITLLDNVALTERVTISKELTLNLNGKKISAEGVAGGYGAIYVGTKGNLIITGKGKIVGGDYAIGNYGTVTVENGTFSGADAALYNFYYNDSTYGKATIKDGKFENSLWNCGELTIEKGVFAELDNSGKATISGGYFNNLIAKDGSDAAGEGTAALLISGGYFTQDPTAYKAEGKVVESVDKDGYTYKVGEPTPEPTPTPSTGGGSSKPKYTASVDKNDVDNGNVKLSSTRAKAGSKVTVTVTPDAGYELKKLVILDKDGNKVDVTDNGDGTFTFKMPKGGVEVVPTFVEAEEDADVSEESADSADKEETVLVLTIDQRVYQQDGNYAVNDVAPIISGERTFLPIRLIAEALGATVSWENETQAVTIVDGDTTIVIYMGQPFATVNGTPVQLDAPAFIANGRTYLPVRFIAENLGATVNWDAEAKTVTIIG